MDFGCSSTCVALAVGGREPQVVVVDGQPLLASAVCVGVDGTLFVGQEAERRAAVEPSRFEAHPKRRVDDGELLLGDVVVPVATVFRAVIGRAVAEARRVAGGGLVDQLVLTHPADWGSVRTGVLRQAAVNLARQVRLVPEPVAAAVFHAASVPGAGRVIAVLDLGGGTTDVSVVRTKPNVVLATKGNPAFGGADVDQLLLDHLGRTVSDQAAWAELMAGRDLLDRRRRRLLHQDVRGAKESLSRHTYTDVPLPSPFPDAHVTRDDLERLIRPAITAAVELTAAAIAEAGGADAVFLVGGSSRIPLVARLVAERTGIVPVTLDQPETVVARGALRAVAAEVEQTGVLSAPRALPGAPQRETVHLGAPGGTARPEPRKPTTKLFVGIGVLFALIAAAATVLVLVNGSGADAPKVARYDYRFSLPDGWTQTGGNPNIARTDVKPTGAEQGNDLVIIQERKLSFDSGTDRERAVARLREDFTKGGSGLSDFRDHASFAGRDVVYYREQVPDQGATVDWYVLLGGTFQVSVGCQYTPDGRDAVQAACTTVVRSVEVGGGQ
ncbi:type VII secretion-associated protein [Actinokineospora inagensis]|uniref:type VII secretion-associated protein n=1 Tax=Actinokineospora inagensis TaxID=103730 RepID=UPI00047C9BA3